MLTKPVEKNDDFMSPPLKVNGAIESKPTYRKLSFSVRTLSDYVAADVIFVVKQFRKDWNSIEDKEIHFSVLKGGVTNKLYRCSIKTHFDKNHESSYGYSNDPEDDGPHNDAVLVRVYGNHTELLIDRQAELHNIESLASAGFAPTVFGSFSNGFVYGYFEGSALTPEDLRSCRFNERIAIKLALWHKQCISQSNSKEAVFWINCHKWLKLIPNSFKNIEKNRKFLTELSFVEFLDINGHPSNLAQKDSRESRNLLSCENGLLNDDSFSDIRLGIERLRLELFNLRKRLSSQESPIVFCHNDLLGPNIIWEHKTDALNFIDYEYGGFNYRAFDIGNHFNEWAGFEFDYTKYPNKTQQYQFFHAYLKEFYGTEPSENDLHNLYVEVNKFALGSHILWGIWALVQEYYSDIDFDFLQYGIDRFKQYFKIRDEVLALE